MKNILILIAVILAVESFNSFKYNDQHKICMDKDTSVPEDARLTVPQLLVKYGYPVEVHTIITSDGYILEMHRITQGQQTSKRKKRAVLVQHGLLGSSALWLNAGPKKGLGYILADAGYDVWLSNFRGNRYSRNHTHLNPDKDAKKFWDFSWHEMGIYDLPTSIDYIIKQTKQPKIFYIGYSQGTTAFYVMGSEKPEYNNKIAVAISLGPVAYMKNMFSPILRTVSAFQGEIVSIVKWIGLHEFVPDSTLLNMASDLLCGFHSVFLPLCKNALFAVVGFNTKQMNISLIPIVNGHSPAGGSTKQVLHYGQLHSSGKFRQYDYGVQKNLKYYGTRMPPNYKLKNISTPLYIYYSRNDWMSHEKDVHRLTNELGNVVEKFLVKDKKFNHMDYVLGIDAPNLIYKRILKVFATL